MSMFYKPRRVESEDPLKKSKKTKAENCGQRQRGPRASRPVVAVDLLRPK
jgi:hypothetical protein